MFLYSGWHIPFCLTFHNNIQAIYIVESLTTPLIFCQFKHFEIALFTWESKLIAKGYLIMEKCLAN